MFTTAKKYFHDSLEEFNHVAWPTKNQAIRLTGIVISFVVIAAITIGGIDILLKYITKTINT